MIVACISTATISREIRETYCSQEEFSGADNHERNSGRHDCTSSCGVSLAVNLTPAYNEVMETDFAGAFYTPEDSEL